MKRFAFFGTSRFSVIILEDLKNKFDIVPALLVTLGDKPKGRKQILTPPETKVWAENNEVPVFQPENLKTEEISDKLQKFDFFIVASYGKIIPKSVLEIPQKGVLNIHPSLLPNYRGASPIQTQILNGEKKMGTTIMLMDEKMDHGPTLAQKEVIFGDPFVGPYELVEEKLAHESAELLVMMLQPWLKDDIKSTEQDENKATFTSMINKEDGEIKLEDDAEKNYRKYLAFHQWPKVFFFSEIDGIKKRNIITEAKLENGKFKIIKIIPEGRKETYYNS